MILFKNRKVSDEEFMMSFPLWKDPYFEEDIEVLTKKREQREEILRGLLELQESLERLSQAVNRFAKQARGGA